MLTSADYIKLLIGYYADLSILLFMLTSADPERNATKKLCLERILCVERRDKNRWNSEMVASREIGGWRGGTIRSGHASWREE